jgi:lipid II:glycine glycyltransferase (peptidoglycan interpeptide bridge formation enzyme)
MHITQKPVKLCLAQFGFLVKHNHEFQHAGSAPSVPKTMKEKNRTEKLLTAKFAKKARRSQRKEKNLGVKIFHFPHS